MRILLISLLLIAASASAQSPPSVDCDAVRNSTVPFELAYHGQDGTKTVVQATGEATGFIPAPSDEGKPITVIGTNSIRAGFDAMCLQQALNARSAPGVTDLVLNPDAHAGYGAPVGCVLTSPTHIYPGPVGVDIKCSMSLLQLDLPADQIADKPLRRALINAITERTPTGPGKGQRSDEEQSFHGTASELGAFC